MARKKESKTKKNLKTFLFLLCISFVAWGTYSIGKLIIKPANMFIVNNGEIYKADLGFTDHDWNGKYEPVTDDMYTQPTSGYIEKVN